MTDDPELLRRYAEEKSEAAFAELVQRHLNFVYATALRRVGGDTHLAEDVTQQVFVALARAAAPLSRRPVLAGWLYTTARFASAQVVRTERRRQTRELEAHTMNELTSASARDADWERLRPVLDETMDELDERDREAVLLRFFEARSFADIGAKLRLTENTARMRVERALDKLHALLARRGVTSTTSALALALSNQVAVAAPAGLGATVIGAALAGGAGLATAGAVGGGIVAFMSTGKIVLGLVGVAAIAGLGAAYVAAGTAREAESEYATASARQVALNAKLTELEHRVQAETQHARQADDEIGRLLTQAQKMKVAPAGVAPAPLERITTEVVMARFKRAQELARTGDPAEALRELLWCYDVGMAQIRTMVGMRYDGALNALVALAERHPAARTALLERQEKARKTMQADGQDFDAAMAFGAISRVLKDGAATVAILDQLPTGDSRRMALAMAAFDDLLAARRYAVALEGRPYAMVSATVERSIENPARDPEMAEQVKTVEALAGSGDLGRARALAARLLVLDGSDRTRALLQQHAARAGHPDLLTAPAR